MERDGLPQRKALRLREFDYSSVGYYFVTACTREKEHYFWDAVGATLGRPPLSPLGHIVENELLRIPDVYPGILLDKYIIMPNHIHIIVGIENRTVLDGRPRVAPTLSRIIQQTKGRVTKQAGFPVWQKSFYDHIIRNETDYLNIWHYIDTNPQKWEDDCYYKESD